MIDPDGMPFFFSSRLRKTLAWLALCAMCLGAVAPTVSKWLAVRAQAADLIAICDEHGMTLIPASAIQPQAQDQGQGGHHDGSSTGHHQSGDEGDCCPYCTLLHHSPGVPVAASAAAPHAPLLGAHYVVADVPVPALRVGHRPHMPQAPPFALA